MDDQKPPTGPFEAWMRHTNRKPEQIAAAIGVSKAAVYGWIRGEYKPELTAAIAIEELSDGAVPIESFGHDTNLVVEMRRMLARRDLAKAVGS